MAKVTIKTHANDADVDAFLEGVEDARQRADSETLIALMQRVTGSPPRMWGPSIIGFGSTRLKYASGRELDWMQCGFSPRKAALSIYLTCDIAQYEHLLSRLGKYKTGKGCLYVKRLSDVDMKVLEAMVQEAVA